MATMRANKLPEGYLFAIVNSLDTVIQLGVKVSSSHSQNHFNISLIYNDAYTKAPSESLASFQLPYEPKVWINFAIQVMHDRIALYHNCIKVQETNVSKEPKELVFESASTFYLAQAGILGSSREKFEVSLKSFFFIEICQQKLNVMKIALASVPMSCQFHINVEHVFVTLIYPANQNNFQDLSPRMLFKSFQQTS